MPQAATRVITDSRKLDENTCTDDVLAGRTRVGWCSSSERKLMERGMVGPLAPRRSHRNPFASSGSHSCETIVFRPSLRGKNDERGVEMSTAVSRTISVPGSLRSLAR